MESRLSEAQWQRSEDRLRHDEERSAHTFDQGRAERMRISLGEVTEELRLERIARQELDFLVASLRQAIATTQASTSER